MAFYGLSACSNVSSTLIDLNSHSASASSSSMLSHSAASSLPQSAASEQGSNVTDDDLLDYIFNPELQGSPLGAPVLLDLDLHAMMKLCRPSHLPTDSLSDDFSQPTGQLLLELRQLELQAISLAEERKYEEALAKLNECIQRCPHYASAYNNRCQVHLLLSSSSASASSSNSASVPSSTISTSVSSALSDANSSIFYSSSLSRQHISILRRALNQRGLILKRLGDENSALLAFEWAGKCGSKFGRKEAVKVNPYSAMCNAFLTSQLEQMCQTNGNNPTHLQTHTVNIAVTETATSASNNRSVPEGKADFP